MEARRESDLISMMLGVSVEYGRAQTFNLHFGGAYHFQISFGFKFFLRETRKPFDEISMHLILDLSQDFLRSLKNLFICLIKQLDSKLVPIRQQGELPLID